MNTVTEKRFDQAGSVDEVVASVRDYMEGWTTRELDRLPRYNRPARIDDAESVRRWAERLTSYEPAASQDPVNSALFVSLRDCFARACERLEQVSGGTRSA